MNTTPTTKTAPRKWTKYRLCARHAHLGRYGRRRVLEAFCEGGPTTGGPCAPDNPCRIWPGTDAYIESVCHGEADWPRHWAVNRKES